MPRDFYLGNIIGEEPSGVQRYHGARLRHQKSLVIDVVVEGFDLSGGQGKHAAQTQPCDQ